MCKQQAGLGLGSKPWELDVTGNRGQESQGQEGVAGELQTCFVGHVELPDVFVTSGGEDLNQAGLISTSPLRWQRKNIAHASDRALIGTQEGQQVPHTHTTHASKASSPPSPRQ